MSGIVRSLGGLAHESSYEGWKGCFPGQAWEEEK